MSTEISVEAAKKVDFPTFGFPTSPIRTENPPRITLLQRMGLVEHGQLQYPIQGG